MLVEQLLQNLFALWGAVSERESGAAVFLLRSSLVRNKLSTQMDRALQPTSLILLTALSSCHSFVGFAESSVSSARFFFMKLFFGLVCSLLPLSQLTCIETPSFFSKHLKPALTIFFNFIHLRRENFQPWHLLLDPLNSLFSLGQEWSVIQHHLWVFAFSACCRCSLFHVTPSQSSALGALLIYYFSGCYLDL